MHTTRLQQIRSRFELETAALRLETRSRQLAEAVKQAKWARRAQQEKLLSYQGSIRGFFDKLRGSREAREEALSLELRREEAVLNDLLRQQEALKSELIRVSAQLELLPSRQELWEQLAEDPVSAGEFNRMEAKFCAEALIPLLEENETALFELRRLMRGDRAGEFMTAEDQQAIHAAPNVSAGKCKPLLERMKTALDGLDIPFEIGSYYRSPAAFLVSAAAEHTRRDRVNQAMDQVASVKKQAARLLMQLEQ